MEITQAKPFGNRPEKFLKTDRTYAATTSRWGMICESHQVIHMKRNLFKCHRTGLIISLQQPSINEPASSVQFWCPQ